MGKSKTNLAEKFTQLSLEWHPILNGVLTPCDVSPSGKMKVWWNIFLIRVTEIPEALADKVFVSGKMPFHLVQDIMRCILDHDNNHLFSDNISHYLNAVTFQASDLFKTTYDNMRKRIVGCETEIEYFDCAF